MLRHANNWPEYPNDRLKKKNTVKFKTTPPKHWNLLPNYAYGAKGEQTGLQRNWAATTRLKSLETVVNSTLASQIFYLLIFF